MNYAERLASCPCLNLRRASKVLTSLFNEQMKDSGVLITQLPVLGALKVDGALPLTRLAKILDMDRTTLSRNVNPMLKLGLLSQGPGLDRRNRILEITTKGAQALEKALPLWDGAQNKVKELLGEEGLAVLLEKTKEIG